MEKRVTIIDTFGSLFRSYHALPKLQSREGFPTGLLTGFINLIYQLTQQEEYLIFALDSPGESFRSLLYPSYKAQRPEPPSDLKLQLEVALRWIGEMGFQTLEREGYEADDLIASLARLATSQGLKVRIISYDKDLYQLVEDGKVELYDPVRKEVIHEREVVKKFGVPPSLIRDYLALVGDSSDNIPGVKGIGAKSAAALLTQFGSLEGIYRNLEKISPPRRARLLEEGRERAFLSRELVTLRDDLIESFDFEGAKLPSLNPILTIADQLIEYGITGVLKRLKERPLALERSQLQFEPVLIRRREELEEIISRIPEGSPVAFDIESDSLETREANIVGFSFAWEPGKAYYVPMGHSYLGVGEQVELEEGLKGIERLLDHPTIGHNLKFDLSILRRFGIEGGEIRDTMVLGWLIDPEGALRLESLAKRYLGVDLTAYKEVAPKGKNFKEVTVEEAARYSGEDSLAALLLYRRLKEELKGIDAPHLIEEAEEVEFPFIKILIEMEQAGVRVEVEYLQELREKYRAQLEELKGEIYRLAGGEFNINSPKQLSTVLFEKLKLPPKRKTKSGYSTDETTLKSLEGRDPIITPLLRYRELFKLLTTYVEPLIDHAQRDPHQRIYTHFLQTGTATGRLASRDPNLQNIPVRGVGREIRHAFVAPEGRLLVALDYSQIELRLLAHFSGDPSLGEAFREGRDIHLETAQKLFGPQEAPSKRGIAKAINFGLIYGMGSRKLASTLNISTKEAEEIIREYFNSFPTVQKYLEELQNSVRERGFVETLLGRRRYFDFSTSSGGRVAAMIREATNTLFQGSAADLMKLAMLEIGRREKGGMMLLQIHDELLFEVDEGEAEEYGERVRKIMEGIYPLKVPIVANLSIGRSWGNLK
ncbi:MAG: DNA polymerase I [Epsilonproteobacteria bacterium]|nr:DNA polymerase I [Campylobacterota bacterium]NPA56609.1 DNA polymerase I [Campylobacterota bacterium]